MTGHSNASNVSMADQDLKTENGGDLIIQNVSEEDVSSFNPDAKSTNPNLLLTSVSSAQMLKASLADVVLN